MNLSKLFTSLALATIVCTNTIAQSQKPEVSISDLYTYWTFYPEYPDELHSMQDGNSYTLLSYDRTQIEQFNYADGKKIATLFDLSEAKGDHNLKTISGYEISSTGDYFIVWGNTKSIYRRSYKADHYIYDVYHKTLTPLTKDGAEQEATFSPNGSMISYVKDNNLYVYKLRYQTSSAVTKDGEFNKIINAIPDWVYEEEFSIKRSYEWSTDSKKIAFVRFDESNVKEFNFPLYKASYPTMSDYALYPGLYTYKYPKAGEENSKISVLIYDIDQRTTKSFDLGKEECYVPRLAWTGQQDQLAVFKLNRLQNKMEVLGVNANSMVSTQLLLDRNKRFIDEPAYLKLTFIHGGEDFLTLSEEDGWNHLYLYGINGVLKAKITDGDFDVTDLYGINEETNTVYFQAAKRDALQREIYAYNIKTKKTTTIASARGTNNAEFSNGCKYFVLSNSSTETVPVYTLCDAKGKTLRTIEDNANLKNLVSTRDFAYKQFTTFKAADGTTDLNAWILRPSNFDESQKYPVLMTQYSGPNSQEVTDSWEVGWEQTLASRGYIVVCVDPRGTAARGEEFRKCTYLQLGKYESDDQIAAAKQIAELPYVDASRIGIWGWSFGGFMSTSCLCKSDIFKMGIAVAPVINWRFYDTVYTERYMRKPEQNGNGYDDNSPLSMARNLKGNYLVIAGTADDNVHCQNQYEMVDALVQAGIQFDMFTYPNRNHGIYGGRARTHLYTMMLNYVLKNL